MQEFGLNTLKSRKATALELEIAREKATALGAAGKKLEASLALYSRTCRANSPTRDLDRIAEEIAANISALIVQRELVGLVHENLNWALMSYEIPVAALRRLGVKTHG